MKTNNGDDPKRPYSKEEKEIIKKQRIEQEKKDATKYANEASRALVKKEQKYEPLSEDEENVFDSPEERERFFSKHSKDPKTLDAELEKRKEIMGNKRAEWRKSNNKDALGRIPVKDKDVSMKKID